jgi:hypothetical protein
MIIYKATFTNYWIIEELEAANLRTIGANATVDKFGTIRNNQFFKTKEAAAKWINKEYVSADEIIRIKNKSFAA